MRLVHPINLNLIFLFLSIFFVPFLVDSGVYLKYELPKIIAFRIVIEIWVLYFFCINKYIFSYLKKYLCKYSIHLLIILAILLLLYLNSGNQIAFVWGTYHKRFGLFTIVHLIVFAYLSAYTIRNHYQEFVSWFKILIPISLVSMFLYCCYQFYFTEILTKTGGRWIGTFGQPDFLGLYVLCLLPFLVNSYLDSKVISKLKLLNILALICSVFMIFFSGSRIVLILAILYLLCLVIKKAAKEFSISKIIYLLITFIVSLILILNSRIVQIGIEEEFRFTIWKASLSILKENWLFGIGLDNTAYYLPEGLSRLGVHSEIFVDRSHNEILDWMLYLGLPVFIFASVYIMKYLNYPIKKKQISTFSNSLLISLIGWFVYSMVNNNGIWGYIWVSFLGGYFLSSSFAIYQYKKSLSSYNWYSILIAVILFCAFIINLFEYAGDNYFKRYQNTGNIIYLQNAYSLNPKEEIYWSFLLSKQIYNENKYIQDQKRIYPSTQKLITSS